MIDVMFTPDLFGLLALFLDIYGWVLIVACLRYSLRYLWISNALKPTRNVPADVSQITTYVADSEAKSHARSPIKPGAEKHIYWAKGEGEKTKHAVVYVHGFSACRQDCQPVIAKVAEWLGWNVFYARLSGHGGEDPSLKMQDSRSHDFVQDMHEALKAGETISEEGIVLIGMSTGAALSTFGLTTELGRKIVRKVILISPAFGFENVALDFLCQHFMLGDLWIRGLILRLYLGNYDSWEAQTEKQGYWWSTIYPSYSLVALMDAVGLARWSVTRNGSTSLPVLCIASPNDTTVLYSKTKSLVANLSKDVEFFCPPYECRNGHCIVGANVSPSSVQPTIVKMKQFLGEMK